MSKAAFTSDINEILSALNCTQEYIFIWFPMEILSDWKYWLSKKIFNIGSFIRTFWNRMSFLMLKSWICYMLLFRKAKHKWTQLYQLKVWYRCYTKFWRLVQIYYQYSWFQISNIIEILPNISNFLWMLPSEYHLYAQGQFDYGRFSMFVRLGQSISYEYSPEIGNFQSIGTLVEFIVTLLGNFTGYYYCW